MLRGAELRWPIIDKEALALYFAITSFKAYVYDGREFLAFTDNLSLILMMKNKDSTSRIMNFKMKLSGYDFKLLHRLVKHNVVPDCLSRPSTVNGMTINTYRLKMIEHFLENQEEELNSEMISFVQKNEKNEGIQVCFTDDSTNIPVEAIAQVQFQNFLKGVTVDICEVIDRIQDIMEKKGYFSVQDTSGKVRTLIVWIKLKIGYIKIFLMRQQ
jgi:RNase H-like domain found in reverse transcriptase